MLRGDYEYLNTSILLNFRLIYIHWHTINIMHTGKESALIFKLIPEISRFLFNTLLDFPSLENSCCGEERRERISLKLIDGENKALFLSDCYQTLPAEIFCRPHYPFVDKSLFQLLKFLLLFLFSVDEIISLPFINATFA